MNEFLKLLDLTYADITAYLGLAAMGLLSLNIILGILVSIKFDTRKHWPYYKISIFNLHNWTGYAALFIVLMHPASLLLSESTKFHFFDILFPVKAPFQPLENSIGALALYSVVFVVVTSYFRSKFQYRFWKKLHYVSYALFGFMFYHGIFTDPSLQDQPIDYLDGGKIFVEAALIVVISFIIWRLRVARLPKNKLEKKLV